MRRPINMELRYSMHSALRQNLEKDVNNARDYISLATEEHA